MDRSKNLTSRTKISHGFHGASGQLQASCAGVESEYEPLLEASCPIPLFHDRVDA